MGRQSFEMENQMVKDAFRIMDFIDELEKIELDENEDLERRKAAAKEKGYQLESLEELKTFMREHRSLMTRLIYFKYIEGYTIEQAAPILAISRGHAAKMHADFTSYLKDPQPNPNRMKYGTKEFKEYLEGLMDLVNPKYETCCEHCGGTTTIPHELARKIFANESRIERVKGNKRGATV